MTFNPALDSLLIAEALKAASLEDIATELERRHAMCKAMAADCRVFAKHEDDELRAQEFCDKADAFENKAATYRFMANAGRAP